MNLIKFSIILALFISKVFCFSVKEYCLTTSVVTVTVTTRNSFPKPNPEPVELTSMSLFSSELSIIDSAEKTTLKTFLTTLKSKKSSTWFNTSSQFINSDNAVFSTTGPDSLSYSAAQSTNMDLSSSSLLPTSSSYVSSQNHLPSFSASSANDVTETTKTSISSEKTSISSKLPLPPHSIVSSDSSLLTFPLTSSTATTSELFSTSTETIAITSTEAIATTSNSSVFDFQKVYLEKQNEFRALMQDTNPLVWNDKIASMAQNYADKYDCSGRLTHSGMSFNGVGLGENIAIGFDFQSAAGVTAWFNEIVDYNYDKPGFSEATGHFTQLVWADSTEVGCGYKYCGTHWNYYVVCEYSPLGNVDYWDLKGILYNQNVHKPINESTYHEV